MWYTVIFLSKDASWMQHSQSQQTVLIEQSACIVVLYVVAKYFKHLMQPNDLKYYLQGGKFWNGITPSSCKDTYHFQYGQVILQGLLCISCICCSLNSAGSCMRLEVKGQAMCCCLRQVTGCQVRTHVYQFLLSFDSK